MNLTCPYCDAHIDAAARVARGSVPEMSDEVTRVAELPTTAATKDTAAPEYEYAEHVRRIVDDFPPLTAKQKDEIAALLRPIIRSDRQPAA